MASSKLSGLIECPFNKAWLEFNYIPGDRVSDILAAIEAKWKGKPFPSLKDSSSWAIFCEQEDGEYMALKRNDKIPISPPAAARVHVDAFTVKFGIDEKGFLDVYDFTRGFSENRFWELDDGRPHIDQNFSLNLSFSKDYNPPPMATYDIKLLALIAIVGG